MWKHNLIPRCGVSASGWIRSDGLVSGFHPASHQHSCTGWGLSKWGLTAPVRRLGFIGGRTASSCYRLLSWLTKIGYQRFLGQLVALSCLSAFEVKLGEGVEGRKGRYQWSLQYRIGEGVGLRNQDDVVCEPAPASGFCSCFYAFTPSFLLASTRR